MELYFPVDLTGNMNMIKKLVLGGTGNGDLPIHCWLSQKLSLIWIDFSLELNSRYFNIRHASNLISDIIN